MICKITLYLILLMLWALKNCFTQKCMVWNHIFQFFSEMVIDRGKITSTIFNYHKFFQLLCYLQNYSIVETFDVTSIEKFHRPRMQSSESYFLFFFFFFLAEIVRDRRKLITLFLYLVWFLRKMKKIKFYCIIIEKSNISDWYISGWLGYLYIELCYSIRLFYTTFLKIFISLCNSTIESIIWIIY